MRSIVTQFRQKPYLLTKLLAGIQLHQIHPDDKDRARICNVAFLSFTSVAESPTAL
jgi:hypothetical protein